MSHDLLWILQAVFWAPFGVRLVVSLLRRARPTRASSGSWWPAGIVLAQSAALGVMYEALLRHTAPPDPWPTTAAQAAVGAFLIVVATLVAAWALLVLRSWRVIAAVDEDHELCTRGPFRLVRHPIYLALGLVAVGSAVWVPTTQVLVGASLGVLLGDVRARAEERLLAAHFGAPYLAYVKRSSRFLPGIY